MIGKLLFILSVILLPAIGNAQLGGLMNKVKSKVNHRVDNKVDQAIDRTLDDIEGKPSASKPATNNSPKPAAVEEEKEEAKPALKSNSRFDFVPGEKVLYAEDFGQDVIGEMPISWNSGGKGEVRTVDGKQGKWLRLFEGNTYLSGNKQSFGENYTVEFDMIFYFEPKVKGYLLPDFEFGMFSSGTEDNTDNAFLKDQNQHNSVYVHFHTGNGAATVYSYKDRIQKFHSDRIPVTGFLDRFNIVQHYAIQVQKQRFRLWINETKVFDIPRAVTPGDTLNQMFFSMEGSNYGEEEVGLFMTNLKVATGLPDTRHKLIEEGKFSTTGILFDFQSAVIKAESHGVIKEIAAVLKDNAAVKIKVVGHTSNDGDDAANMELSKQRATAVKEILSKEYGIDAARIESEGKGETQPVADNKTKEGKVQNRRVEFIKL